MALKLSRAVEGDAEAESLKEQLQYRSRSRRGGVPGVAAATVGLGVALFTQLEGWEPLDAAYYSVITGTTIGYGDKAPVTDNGKLAAAVYALIAVNVVGGLLSPAADYLSALCADDDEKKGQ